MIRTTRPTGSATDLSLANSWVLMGPGGPPAPDEPEISVVNYRLGNTVSSLMNLRVADVQAC